ncbi:glycosidase [Longilinea arvoryzae]|uniref:Glycosidase n=1 Tax=Longilinea arvoryzae TaxID=360412 RepID=A0A0S7BM97_9CHLR|nr:alpha-amylase family glycosyl hydrolase [Longilinea arvoryzae]GAP15346.1 glycosidase [Longilinea arvoryzae]
MPVDLSSIHHDGSGRYVKTLANPSIHLGDNVQLRIRAGLDTPVDRVFVYTCPDGEGRYDEMQPEPGGRACRWWSIQIPISMPQTGYRFLILVGGIPYWYNASGLHDFTVTDSDDFRLLADYQSPDWVRQSVFYLVFPDRFCDGNSENNLRNGEFTYRGETARACRWGEPPSPGGLAKMVEFYGGDLDGVLSKLDYLSDLGVNSVYLTPIFTSFSNHRYDVVDYFNVDPHLGGNSALIALRRATADRGMRLILDIVPNHCGVAHPWFQQAQADPNSRTAEYFTFQKRPDEYACWLGVKSLPKLNYNSLALRRAMYSDPDSVFRHWMKAPYTIDGWRIDVANMLGRQGASQLGMEVGRGIRAAVKTENPQAYLLGENFFDPALQLQGDFLDAAMNYAGFTTPLWFWLTTFQFSTGMKRELIQAPGGFSTQALVDSWQAYRSSIPWQIVNQQFNTLGTHDTPRIQTILKNDPARVQLAVALLMTTPGVPCIFYGDEIGLKGAGLDSRVCMAWDESSWNHALLEDYRRLIHLRRTSPALSEGGFQILAVEKDSFGFLRDADQEQIIVTAHRGASPRPAGSLAVAQGGIEDGAEFVEFYNNRHALVASGRLPLPEQPAGAMIWIRKI